MSLVWAAMITAPLGKAVNSQKASSWLLPKAWAASL